MTRIVVDPYEATGIVYGLHDGDGVIRYVGQTSRGLRQRMNEHVHHALMHDHRNTNPGLADWICSLATLHVQVLEVGIPVTSLSAWEKHHIQVRRPDLNVAAAHQPRGANSQVGRRWTDEQRAAQSERTRAWHAQRRAQ